MRPVLVVALAALAAVALLLGCPPLPSPPTQVMECTFACTEGHSWSIPMMGSGHEDYPVNLLVRSFLPRGERERAGYAFQSYLFFADRAADTALARHAAAGAVLQLFSDVRDVISLHIEDAQLAVLYVPVVSFKAASTIPVSFVGATGRLWRFDAHNDSETLLKRAGADRLVEDYDYDRARLIKGQIEHATRMALPRVALLGSSRPLGDTAAIDPAQLYIVDLEHASDAAAEDLLIRFRNALESRSESLSAQVPSASNPALGYFEREGVVLANYHGEN